MAADHSPEPASAGQPADRAAAEGAGPPETSDLFRGRKRQRGRSGAERAAGLAQTILELEAEEGGETSTRETHQKNR